MTSPGEKSNDDIAWMKPAVAFATIATFDAGAPIRFPRSPYTRATSDALASAASYPPISPSRCRCSVHAAITGAGMSAAPALFRWTRLAQPGVSLRHRCRSSSFVIPEKLLPPCRRLVPHRPELRRLPVIRPVTRIGELHSKAIQHRDILGDACKIPLRRIVFVCRLVIGVAPVHYISGLTRFLSTGHQVDAAVHVQHGYATLRHREMI